MSRKNNQNKKNRQERIRKQKHISTINSLYPEFIFVNEHVCDADYVKIVKEIVKSISFKQFVFDEKYNDIFHKFLKETVKFGYRQAFFRAAGVDDTLSKLPKKRILTANPFSNSIKNRETFLYSEDNDAVSCFNKIANFCVVHEKLVVGIGDNILFSKYKEEFFKFYPEQGFRIAFVGNKICFIFQRIYQIGSMENHGFSYMIPKKIKWGNKEYNLIFKNHALSRMIQRFSNNGKSSYASYILLYEFFRNMKYKFDYFSNGRQFIQFYFPSFTKIYNTVVEIHSSDKNLTSIQGEKPDPLSDNMYYVKCFSSPIDVIGDNLYIITALLPGYIPTPESSLYNSSNTSNMKLKDRIRHLYFSEIDIRSPEYCEAIKFFHSNGIPQVFIEKLFFEFPRNHHDYVAQLFDYLEKPEQITMTG